VHLADLPPLLAIRSSFRWKLLLALFGSVLLLAAITLGVVRRETMRQIETATLLAGERSAQALLELEEQNRENLSQLSGVFTGSRQVLAAVEAALEARDGEALRQDVLYEFDRLGIPPDRVTAFTDGFGKPVLAMSGRDALPGDDPAGVGPAAERVLYGGEDHVRAYRLIQGRLYTVETVLLQLGRPVGTVTLGVPLGEASVGRLGNVLGAEVCFVVDARCVVGTARLRPELERAMVRQAETGALAEIAGERWGLVSGRFSPDDDAVRWAIALPLASVEGPFQRVERALLAGAAGALLLAGLFAMFLSASLTRPIHALVEATSRVGAGDYGAHVEAHSTDEIGVLARAFNEMSDGLALKEKYRGVLDKVVSRDIAEELLKGDVRLGGENREVTVVFADMTGFTKLTDGMDPPRVIALLNECMGRLSEVVEAEGGVVDKYVGDEIMALFGAPVARDRDALRGVRAALGMQRAMQGLNQERALRGEPPLAISVGLNTGIVMAGNMGSPSRLNYTVLGDAVNLAARVQKLAGSAQVLITEHTYRQVTEDVRVRDLGPTELRGFAHSVRLYELLDLAQDVPAPKPAAGALAPVVHGVALAAALLFAAPPAQAQIVEELPTLERLFFSSRSGALQLGFSGRLDVEAYLPQDDPAWIIPSTDPFLAPRLRVFADAFLGDRLLATGELRVDRGEEPAAGDLGARIDQAFLRFLPGAGITLQAGKFVSPFAGYGQRHHSAADPLIRPPLPYDHRTVLTAGHAPGSAASLLGWKDSPEEHRPTGAPIVWGTPYQWGAMVTGGAGRLSARAALMNSAPSSEPEEWGLQRGFSAPSLVLNAGLQLLPSLRVEGSFNEGPWMRDAATGLPAGKKAEYYDQRIWGGEAVFTRGRSKVRGEVFHDTWRVPNVDSDVVDVSWYVEGESDVRRGLTLVARYGRIHFLELQGFEPGGHAWAADAAKWDYDVSRFQLGAAYRLARNAGIRVEAALNGTDGPRRVRNDLGALQFWWEF